MSAIKDGRLPITLDKERHLYFSLHVMDEMQDKFGGFDKLGEIMQGKDALKNVTWLLTRLLNEGEIYTRFLEVGTMEGAEELNERIVGLLLNAGNMGEIKTAIFKAFAKGTRGSDDPPEGDADADGEDNDKEGNGTAGKG